MLVRVNLKRLKFPDNNPLARTHGASIPQPLTAAP